MIKPSKKCRASLNTGYIHLIIHPSSLLIKKGRRHFSEFFELSFVIRPLTGASDWEKQSLR